MKLLALSLILLIVLTLCNTTLCESKNVIFHQKQRCKGTGKTFGEGCHSGPLFHQYSGEPKQGDHFGIEILETKCGLKYVIIKLYEDKCENVKDEFSLHQVGRLDCLPLLNTLIIDGEHYNSASFGNTVSVNPEQVCLA
jgi:hypothetical protein